MHEIVFVGLLSYVQWASPTLRIIQVISRLGAVRGRQEQPGAAKSSQAPPGTARSGQGRPGAAKDYQGPVGAASSEKERDENVNTIVKIL